jgi:hypothetical protein
MVPKSCSASDVTENVNAITDSWCTYNEAGTCQYLKCGVATVNGNCNLYPTGNYWEPDKTCLSGDTSILWGEKTIFLDDINKYTQIDAQRWVDDSSQIWINNVEVPAFNTAAGWINVKSFFSTGNNIVKFKATDICGWDGSGGDCGGRVFNLDWNVTINPAITVGFNTSTKIGYVLAYEWWYNRWISFNPTTNTCNEWPIVHSSLDRCKADVSCRTTDTTRPLGGISIYLMPYCGENYNAQEYDCLESLPQGGTQNNDFDVVPAINTLRIITSCTVEAKSGTGAWKTIGDCKTKSLFTIRAGTDCAWNQDCIVRISATNDAGISSSAEKTFTISDTTAPYVSTSFSAGSGTASYTTASVSCSAGPDVESGCATWSNCDPTSYKMYVSPSQITSCPDYSSSSYSSIDSFGISSKSWVCSAAKDAAGNPAVSSVFSWDIAPLCGNGNVDSGESCDGSNLNSQTCASQGYSTGTLSCSNCAFVTTGCCNHACSSGQKECTSGTAYHTCQDTSPCRTWGSSTGCSSGYACSGGNCICTPTTCASQGKSCGPSDDSCGHPLDCGTCPTAGTCVSPGNTGRKNIGCVSSSCQTAQAAAHEDCSTPADDDCNGKTNSDDTWCFPPTIDITPNGIISPSNTSFTVNCTGVQGRTCSKLNYSYSNLGTVVYSKSTIGPAARLSINDNVTCNPKNVCRVIINAAANDSNNNKAALTSSEFLIDMQSPVIEKTECTYKAKDIIGRLTDYPCTKGSTSPGNNVTIVAFANDSLIGSGIKDIKIYLKNSSGGQDLLLQSTPLQGSLKRKNTNATIKVTEVGMFDYIVYAEDNVGNNIKSVAGTFNVGGDCTKNCSSQTGKICNFYQVCSTQTICASNAHEDLGITCCLGECLNRSSLATCRLQGGEIYNTEISYCDGGIDAPASDTIEKNKCCKNGIITARSNVNSLSWYDMSGNKLTGAARGDKVRCVGTADTESKTATYTITIKLGDTVISQPATLPVNKTHAAESAPIPLTQVGTYRCEATLVASPPKKMIATLDVETRKLGFFELLLELNPLTGFAIAPANLKVIEAPVKPRYTELPGFSLISLLISISGLLVYYLAKNNQMNK